MKGIRININNDSLQHTLCSKGVTLTSAPMALVKQTKRGKICIEKNIFCILKDRLHKFQGHFTILSSGH
jgi:hypothetical protein